MLSGTLLEMMEVILIPHYCSVIFKFVSNYFLFSYIHQCNKCTCNYKKFRCCVSNGSPRIISREPKEVFLECYMSVRLSVPLAYLGGRGIGVKTRLVKVDKLKIRGTFNN